MAKTEMKCPFRKKPCKECAFYRGRHYYLSFCKSYGGYIEGPGEAIESSGSSPVPGLFKMPSAIPVKTFDPFAIPQKDIR